MVELSDSISYYVDRFCFLIGCGCVFSDRALKEIKDSICANVSIQNTFLHLLLIISLLLAVFTVRPHCLQCRALY